MKPQSPSALLPIAWPLFGELLFGISVSLVGLTLAAHASSAASGAFALANNVQSAFFLLLRVVSIGVSVAITQALGAGNRPLADATARAALGASTWAGLATAVVVAFCARPMLLAMSAPADVLPLATPYLQLLALAIGLDALNACMAAVMRAHLRPRDVLVTILSMHGLHLALCAPLMHGFGPLPALGLQGYALALIASRLFGIALQLHLWRSRLALVPAAHDWWQVRPARLASALHVGLPGAGEGLAYRLCMMATLAVVGRMGTQALATHAYTMQLMLFTVLPGLAIGLATEILVGRAVGAADLRRADGLTHRSLAWGLGFAVGIALLNALAAPWTLRLFTSDESIIRTAQQLFWITVVLEPGRSFNLVVINALRATGDARFPIAAGILSMVIVMAGGAWLLGARLGWGLAGVWIAYSADEWLRGLMMAARWRRRRWLPFAHAARRRARALVPDAAG